MTMRDTPRHIVSYQGESEYEINGKRVRARLFGCERFAYNVGVWQQFIRPSIGAVIFDRHPDCTAFPGPEIMRHFPGYVAARYNIIGDVRDYPNAVWLFETDGPAPATHVIPTTGYVVATDAKRHEDEETARAVAELERKYARPGPTPAHPQAGESFATHSGAID
jgi:hypothetical protein